MALQSIEKKKAEIEAARRGMMNAPSGGKQVVKAVRMGLLVGWLVCLAGAFVFPPLGYVWGVLIVLWIIVGFAGMFVK